MALGACATSPYGNYGMGGPLEAVLGGVLGGGYNTSGYGYGNSGYGNAGYGYNSGSFQQAAVNACGGQASRYGRVSISDVRQQSSSTLRVRGYVSDGYRNNDFACSFRSDGRITDFDI